MEIDPLKRLDKAETLVEKVVAQVQALILNGELTAGHRLPAERELGDRLGVSRTVIRESLAALSAKGLVEASSGGGFRVAVPTAENLMPSLTLFLRGGKPHLDYDRVHEVRSLLEVEIAGLAAERRTDLDLADLETSMTQMRRLRPPFDVEAFATSDVEFHMLLARSAHNPLLWLLMETVADIMKDVRRIGSRVAGTQSRAIRHHSAILAAVRAGDRDKAREEMRGHLAESYETMRRAMKRTDGGQEN